MNVGDRYDAAWGHYRVHRIDGNEVVLNNVDTPVAFVIVSTAELRDRYTFAGAAPAPEPTSRRGSGTPMRFTLGAAVPGTVVTVPTRETYYRSPCLTRRVGDDGKELLAEPHAYHIISNLRFYGRCEACRGVAEAASEPEIPEEAPYSSPGGLPPWGVGEPMWEIAARSGKPRLAAGMREFFEERAAIFEYLGNQIRPMAEHNAYELLQQRWRERHTRRPAA